MASRYCISFSLSDFKQSIMCSYMLCFNWYGTSRAYLHCLFFVRASSASRAARQYCAADDFTRWLPYSSSKREMRSLASMKTCQARSSSFWRTYFSISMQSAWTFDASSSACRALAWQSIRKADTSSPILPRLIHLITFPFRLLLPILESL